MTNSEQAELKRLAGRRAAELVEDGMLVGLGSGTTAREFVRALGERVAGGLRIQGVPSSRRTEQLARELGIPIIEHERPLDLAVDGADAVEQGTLNAIKGLGGALVREKLVVLAALRFVLVIDGSKLYERLADSQPDIPVPVEIMSFGWKLTSRRLENLGRPILRERDGAPFVSDNGNLVVDLFDCDYGDIPALAGELKGMTGVVDHGLFVNLATDAIIARQAGVELVPAGR